MLALYITIHICFEEKKKVTTVILFAGQERSVRRSFCHLYVMNHLVVVLSVDPWYDISKLSFSKSVLCGGRKFCVLIKTTYVYIKWYPVDQFQKSNNHLSEIWSEKMYDKKMWASNSKSLTIPQWVYWMPCEWCMWLSKWHKLHVFYDFVWR